MSAPSAAKSEAEVASWMQRVHTAQSRRSPEALEEAKKKAEASRSLEMNYRKSKAIKSHMVRSRALTAASMMQMSSASAGAEHAAVQARWSAAQMCSKKRQEEAYRSVSAPAAEEAAAVVLADADEEEAEALGEVAGLMGEADVAALALVARDGLADAAAPAPPGAPRAAAGGSKVQELLAQLRTEPEDAEECAAKFMLYDGYSEEVKEMRESTFRFAAEARPSVPEAVAADMDRQLARIDCAEAMGVPDDVREWIVFHMMRQAERNNMKMAGILEGLEKKLQFLATNEQSECPVCLECFAPSGPHVAQTLGCCHKVCKECWENWTVAMHGRPFCPLCKNEEFLGAVAAGLRRGSPMDVDSDSD